MNIIFKIIRIILAVVAAVGTLAGVLNVFFKLQGADKMTPWSTAIFPLIVAVIASIIIYFVSKKIK